MNIKVQGGQILSGEIIPSGSKNSAVALIPASLLFDKPIVLRNIPEITDVERLIKILEKLGSIIVWDKSNRTMKIDNGGVDPSILTSEDLGNMKGTSLLWGPMLARFGKVNFDDLPGGCTLGIRPLNAHYEAFESLGVGIYDGKESVQMDSKNAKPGTVWLTEMSPTVTENLIMFASKLSGMTTIIGAASEPQVQDLCNMLISAGVQIDGVGSSVLKVTGTDRLAAIDHEMLSDHYEIATFLALGATTGGEIRVKNALPALFTHIDYVFGKFGVEVKYDGTTALVESGQKLEIKSASSPLNIKAQPWPSLPVDALPLFIPLALACKSGQALFHNWMYEAGLFWTSELLKFGANVIMADPHRVIVTAGNKLTGCNIEAPYIIRAVVALVMTAMLAQGETTILNADALYRGHPHFEKNLKKLGAEISHFSHPS